MRGGRRQKGEESKDSKERGSEQSRIRPIAFTFLMPAAVNIQLPRALGPYDSNGFDDIFEMIFHPPPFSSCSPPFYLPLVCDGLATPFFFSRGEPRLALSNRCPRNFISTSGMVNRPSSSYIIIEQNIMLADERPAAKMYYDRQREHRCNTDERERERESVAPPSPSSSARSTTSTISSSPAPFVRPSNASVR